MERINSLKEKLYEKIVSRSDAYAVQTGDGSYLKQESQLTLDDYIDDNRTIGAYLLNRNSEVKCFCIDIDVNKDALGKEDMNFFLSILREQTKQIKSVFSNENIPTLTEFSGRKGYHIWGFLKSPVAADKVRIMLKELEKKFEPIDDKLHWEVFPKQDQVAEGKFGNLIKLPLQIHKVSGKRTYFVDENFTEHIPKSIPVIDISVFKKSESEKIEKKRSQGHSSVSPHNMERMIIGCAATQKLIERAESEHHLEHHERIWIANLFVPFGEKGKKKIHDIFKDLSDYDKGKTNSQIDSLKGKPSLCAGMCPVKKCDKIIPTGYESPIGFAYQKEPGDIYEHRGRYMLKTKNSEKVLTEWKAEPKELINLGENDVLRCDITSTQGTHFNSKMIQNEAWHSKQKLLRALGHSELTFHGNDGDVQNLAHYITQRVPLKKKGIGYLGITDDTFVSDGINISKGGISLDPKIQLFIKGEDSLQKKILIRPMEDPVEHLNLLKGLYEHFPHINKPEVIFPIIGWLSLIPLKSKIQKEEGAFFIMHVIGEQGTGKTSTAELIMRLFGYEDATVHDCRMTKFALLSLLSSTNAVPVILDEYRESQMPSYQSQQIKESLRGLYKGSIDSRGRADLTVTNFKLQAPVAIMGEHKISDKAIMERCIFSHFDRAIKSSGTNKYSEHYKNLLRLPLEGFIAEYIKWALGQDLNKYFQEARSFLQNVQSYNMLSSQRHRLNWETLHCGIRLWEEYGKHWNVTVGDIPYDSIFEKQTEEIGLTSAGHDKRDVDTLIEYMAILAEKDLISRRLDFAVFDKDTILIHVKSVMGALRLYRRSTDSDFFVMDDNSFRSQIKEASYFIEFDRRSIDSVEKRWLFLNYPKMISEGLEVEGFKNNQEFNVTRRYRHMVDA